MKKYLIVFCLLLLVSPAYAKSKEVKPEWLNDPYSVCAKEELCAVGMGSGLNSAKADARRGLSKVFETRVKSSYEESLSQSGEETQSKIKDFVSESSDVMLQAVEIKQTYETKTDVYALAVLNKTIASRMTKEEMEGLDEKMLALLKDDSPASAVQIEKLYEQRRTLNQRYIVLAGNGLEEEVTYDQVYANKKAKVGKRHLYMDKSEKLKPALYQTVQNVMKENGFTFAQKQEKDTPKVVLSFVEEPQYMKVEGFVKYSYHFTMKAPDKKGKMIEFLSTTITETGRNQEQTFSSALESLKVYLNENIMNLNF